MSEYRGYRNFNTYFKALENTIEDSEISWDVFKNQTFLISGATGLIGSFLIHALLEANKRFNLEIKIVGLIRNFKKAKIIYGDIPKNLEFIKQDITDPLNINQRIDYIIHTASITSSIEFIKRPVETIQTAVNGTENLLELARVNNIKGFIYLSTMEVYGCPQNDEKIYENRTLPLTPMNIRNSYPISKVLCEALCLSYAQEYNLPINIIRLTQTFGPGVSFDDQRIFAEFGRCGFFGEDIQLRTEGKTKRSYLDITDAVRAIILVLQNPTLKGEVFNAANESSYCSVREMADIVANLYGIDYKFNIDNQERGYAPTLHMNLDTSKLRSLGWKPKVNLEEMYVNLLNYFKEVTN